MGKYFGTDGFRGRAGVTLSSARAFKVGEALGWYFGARLGGKCRAVIGKDARLSSYTLEYALAAGLTSAGADAYILHVTPTASVSYIARCDGFDCGVMISASHNDYRDNGIKIFNAQGEKTEDAVINFVEDCLDGKFTVPCASDDRMGRTVDYVSGRNRYIGHLISLSTCSYKGMRIGLDGANGSAFSIARNVFDALGAKTYCIGCEPDGLNENYGVGSTHPEALKNLVIGNGLDMGFAFDGDADRCIAVDGNGRIITGDEILYIAANHLKARGELNKNKVVCTVLSNGGLIKSLEGIGVKCEVCDVGDRNVCAAMAETGARLGGERSGHVVFSKYESTGDGLVTAIMLMEAAVDGKKSLSQLLKGYCSLPQHTINIPADGERKRIAAKFDTREICRRYGVRMIVRPSGTERVVRIMAESEDIENCKKACAEVAEFFDMHT